MENSLSDIWQLPLICGNSDHPRQGACAMDAVSWLVYGELGDHPKCVCPVITKWVIDINDALSDDQRQKLRHYLLRLIDTVDPDNQDVRNQFLIDHCITKVMPTVVQWLDTQNIQNDVESRIGYTMIAPFCNKNTIPTYLMSVINEASERGVVISDDVIAVLFEGLDGLLAIGRRSDQNYLDAASIEEAHQTFAAAAQDLEGVTL
jgi:hypothetical protein